MNISLLYRKIVNKIRCFFRPRQRWLTKQIPTEWMDKVSLIPLVNFAIVLHFVEKENINEIDWDGSGEELAKFYKELKDCYSYIKSERLILEKKIKYMESIDCPDIEIQYVESVLNKEDTKYLTWIVANRDYFWT